MLDTLRTAMRKRALYYRTVQELQALPTGRTAADLGVDPADAPRIARRAVYGR